MTQPPPPAWDDYRRRRRLFWIAFIGYLPVVAALGIPLNRMLGSERPVGFFALGWLTFFAFAGRRMNNFPCPRCGKPFFYNRGQNPLTQRCMRCDWPKWAERSAAPRNPPS